MTVKSHPGEELLLAYVTGALPYPLEFALASLALAVGAAVQGSVGFGLALIAVLLASVESRVIFEFVLYAWSALGASFGPVIILGLLWKKANRAGAIAGMLTGSIVTVVWRNIPVLKGALYELVPAFFMALLAVYVVSLLTQKNDR